MVSFVLIYFVALVLAAKLFPCVFILILNHYFHCGTRASPNNVHLSLSDVNVLHFAPANAQIPSLHVAFCSPWLLQFLGLPFCYSGCPPVIRSGRDMTWSSLCLHFILLCLGTNCLNLFLFLGTECILSDHTLSFDAVNPRDDVFLRCS